MRKKKKKKIQNSSTKPRTWLESRINEFYIFSYSIEVLEMIYIRKTHTEFFSLPEVILVGDIMCVIIMGDTELPSQWLLRIRYERKR